MSGESQRLFKIVEYKQFVNVVDVIHSEIFKSFRFLCYSSARAAWKKWEYKTKR